MKKILLVLMFTLSCTMLFAGEYKSPVSMYKDNYFIAGNDEDQTKFQISLAGDIFHQWDSGLFLGYTQTTWWQVYDGADTMSANYQPEVFYRLASKKNFFGNKDLGFIDYIQISPYNHLSTGVEGEDHRSINIFYAQAQVSTNGRLSLGMNLKVFGYYTKGAQNPDIEKYKGYYENDIFLKLKSRTIKDMTLAELHFKHGGTATKGWLCVEARTMLFSNQFQPRLFVQYFYGYGENIVQYDIKEHSLYAGLVF